MEQESEAWSPAAQDPEEGESLGGARRGEGLSQVSPTWRSRASCPTKFSLRCPLPAALKEFKTLCPRPMLDTKGERRQTWCQVSELGRVLILGPEWASQDPKSQTPVLGPSWRKHRSFSPFGHNENLGMHGASGLPFTFLKQGKVGQEGGQGKMPNNGNNLTISPPHPLAE